MTVPREPFTMWRRTSKAPIKSIEWRLVVWITYTLIRWSFNFHLCLFLPPLPQGGEGLKGNPSQMPKDLMNCYLSWSLHRNLNRACYSRYSKELRSIQAKIWEDTCSWLTWASAMPAQRLWLCLCPLETTLHTAANVLQSEFYPHGSHDHSPHCSCKNCVSKWILSYGSQDQYLITESQILTFRVLCNSHDLSPVASLSHPFPFPLPVNALSSSHPGPVCCSTYGHVFVFCSRPPYHRAFSWPSLALLSLSISSSQHSSRPGRFSLVLASVS